MTDDGYKNKKENPQPNGWGFILLLFIEFSEVGGDHLVGDGVVLEVTLDESLV